MDARGEYIAPNLSARQRDVFELIVRGRSNKEIARTLNLAEGTVKIHVAALFRKLGVQRRSAVAIAGGAISLPATGVPSSPGLPIHDGFSLESLPRADCPNLKPGLLALLAVELEQVKGAQDDVSIIAALVQLRKQCHAVLVAIHRLPVEQTGAHPQRRHCLDNSG